MSNCPSCINGQAGAGNSDCPILISANILAGLAMMLNIRLSYSSAPYALIRFRLPENLFSVFVRRMASALELWCLPSMLLGNIVEIGLKTYYEIKQYEKDFANNSGNLKDVKSTIQITTGAGTSNKTITVTNLPHRNDTFTPRQYKFFWIIIPSIISQWLNFLTYVLLFIIYVMGGDRGHLTVFYWIIAISGVVFGINMTLVYAADWNYIPVYIAGENSFPIVTSFMHYISTLMFGNRRKYNSDFLIVMIDIWVAIIISFVAAVVWSIAYGVYRNTKKTVISYPKEANNKAKVSIKYGTVANFKCNAANPANPTAGAHATITEAPNKDGTKGNTLTITNLQPDGSATLEDTGTGPVPCTVTEDTKGKTLTIKYTPTGSGEKCITITINDITTPQATVHYGHIFTYKFETNINPHLLSPFLMIVVGMGLVYAIYPGIAPGMIVPFYLIDKIEMVLLIATIFPPVIIAILRKYKKDLSPQYFDDKITFKFKKWYEYEAGWFYLSLNILMVIKITLAVIFIYSLHYRDSNLSRSIINQPKMSTFLSITFYMCHEILLALGFSGFIGNDGGDLILIPQYIGALFMIFLAFYSEGYIIEYKSHDPSHWPTDGMWYLYGYYQLNTDFFIMIKFNVCSDGYCDFK